MFEFRSLLDRFWITRRDNKELYYSVKKALPQYRRLITEQLGWNLIVNESVIKLEKVPTIAMAWMGIQEFQEPMDYCLLCALLLFLSDLDDGEQFLLSALTESLESLLHDTMPVDWTRFPHRKALVRVLRYVQQAGLLVVYDGSSDGFGNNQAQEVLYENTGLSRHFPVHFGRDIIHCRSIEDFEAFSWEGAEAERGQKRIQRVYRQLALSPALYWSSQNTSDYEYVKNQRQWLGRYLGEAIGGELHVHKNGAYFVLEEDSRFGLFHPGSKDLSDVVLLLCGQLREKIVSGAWPRGADDTVLITLREFRREVEQCYERTNSGWGHSLRESSLDKLCKYIEDYMEDWMLLERREDICLLYPGIGKWTGHYPDRYPSGKIKEGTDEPLEDE